MDIPESRREQTSVNGSGIHTPLTIAIPTYNRGPAVRVLIEAITAQASNHDEIIVADDGSNDGTADEASKICGIRVIRQKKNQGMVHNWNVCLHAATKDWICIIHDDDTLEPSGLGVLRHICAKINEPALILPTIRQTECIESLRYSFVAPGPWPVLHCPSIPSGAIIHREIMDKLGVFNPKFSYASDLEYFPRIVAHYPLVIIESPLAVRYNLHDSNYQVKTWKKADFIYQLEEIQRLIVSYARMDGSAAELMVQQRLIECLEYILKEGDRRNDNVLVEQYKKLLGKRGKSFAKVSRQKFSRVVKELLKVFAF
jgi:glycosyltransferase involved in cell wall biosynthesis